MLRCPKGERLRLKSGGSQGFVHEVLCALCVTASTVAADIAHAQDTASPGSSVAPSMPDPVVNADSIPAAIPSVASVTTAPSPASPSLANSDEAELARLDGTLRELSSGQKNYRLWGGLSAIVLGAFSIPTGILIARRDSGLALAGVVFASVGLGEVIGGTFLLMWPFGEIRSFEPLSDSIEEQRQAGKPPRAIVASIESDWQKRASDASSQRHTMAWLGGAIGVLSMSAGTYLALEPVSRWTKSQQIAFSSVFFAFGSLAIIGSLQTYFLEYPVETAWTVYRGRKAPFILPRQQSRVDITPIPGGAMLQVGVRF